MAMKIMYICGKCGSQTEGKLEKVTDFDNTDNMDELHVICQFCGNLLAKMFTDRYC